MEGEFSTLTSGFIVNWTASLSFIQPSFTAGIGDPIAWFLLLRECTPSSVISAVLVVSGRSFFFANVSKMGIPDQPFCHYPHDLFFPSYKEQNFSILKVVML